MGDFFPDSPQGVATANHAPLHKEDTGPPLEVLDLPLMRTEPSYARLLQILNSFKQTANSCISEKDRLYQNRYLNNVIKSGLVWLQEDERGELLDNASERLAERCGRSAAPAMTRTWRITSTLSLHLHEPSLTGDNLGLKTWATAHLLAQRLPSLAATYFTHLLSSPPAPASQDLKVLELGAGTGLLGLSFAALFPSSAVTLTDLPAIVPNLRHNVSLNSHLLSSSSTSSSTYASASSSDTDSFTKPGAPTAAVLDWHEPETSDLYSDWRKGFDVILAADPLYDATHSGALAANIDLFLTGSHSGRVIVQVPLRDVHTEGFKEDLRQHVRDRGFVEVGSGVEGVRDEDWEGGDEVGCWWGVWRRGMGG